MFKVSYQAPQFSVSHQAYVNHGAITRPKVFPKHKSALFLKTPSLGLCARESVQTFEFPSAERYWGSIVVQNLGCSAKDGYSLGRFGEKTHSERPKIISISWYLCVKYHDKSFFQIVHKPLKVLYTNNGEKSVSNYSADFINGTANARRSPIKPEQVQWTDRPKFEANSQYKVLTRQS